MSKSNFFNIKNINLRIFCNDILRGLWIIALVGCIGVMVTYTYIKDSYVPEYTSSSIYVVTPRQSTGYVYTNKRFASSVINVFQNLMNADIMKNRIKKELHLNNLDAAMQVELIPETNLMRITVTSKDPIESFEIIGAIMNNYSELSEYLTADAVFDTLKAPVVATFPDNALTPRKKSLFMGGVWAFGALLVIALVSLFRRTIKTESMIEEGMETTLLGTVYHENKNRTVKAKLENRIKSLLIISPVISSGFIESINNIRIKLEYEHERKPEKNVFLFSSAFENEGKSTVSINVALSLAKEGKKVIVIDADMRKPAVYKMLDIQKYSVVDYVNLLSGKCGLDEVLYRDKNLGMDLILSTEGHSRTYEFMKSGAMKDLIKKCSRLADYVIIDTPPMAMVSDVEALLDSVQFSVLVVRQDFSYEKNIYQCINIMKDSSSKFLGCVLNDYKSLRSDVKGSVYEKKGKAVEIYDE